VQKYAFANPVEVIWEMNTIISKIPLEEFILLLMNRSADYTDILI
jgi:hypothetical protein